MGGKVVGPSGQWAMGRWVVDRGEGNLVPGKSPPPLGFTERIYDRDSTTSLLTFAFECLRGGCVEIFCDVAPYAPLPKNSVCAVSMQDVFRGKLKQQNTDKVMVSQGREHLRHSATADVMLTPPPPIPSWLGDFPAGIGWPLAALTSSGSATRSTAARGTASLGSILAAMSTTTRTPLWGGLVWGGGVQKRGDKHIV